MMPVTVVTTSQPVGITISTREFVTYSGTVDAVEMRIISIRVKSATIVVETYRMPVTCHRFMDDVTRIRHDIIMMLAVIRAPRLRSADVAEIRIISIRNTSVNDSANSDVKSPEPKHRRPLMMYVRFRLKSNFFLTIFFLCRDLAMMFVRHRWHKVIVTIKSIRITLTNGLELVKRFTTRDVVATEIDLNRPNNANNNVQRTRVVVSFLTIIFLFCMSMRSLECCIG